MDQMDSRAEEAKVDALMEMFSDGTADYIFSRTSLEDIESDLLQLGELIEYRDIVESTWSALLDRERKIFAYEITLAIGEITGRDVNEITAVLLHKAQGYMQLKFSLVQSPKDSIELALHEMISETVRTLRAELAMRFQQVFRGKQ